MRGFLIRLLFRLLKNYSIFFLIEDTAFYVNSIYVDTEMKELLLTYEKRS